MEPGDRAAEDAGASTGQGGKKARKERARTTSKVDVNTSQWRTGNAAFNSWFKRKLELVPRNDRGRLVFPDSATEELYNDKWESWSFFTPSFFGSFECNVEAMMLNAVVHTWDPPVQYNRMMPRMPCVIAGFGHQTLAVGWNQGGPITVEDSKTTFAMEYQYRCFLCKLRSF